jgi:hypothetical protein
MTAPVPATAARPSPSSVNTRVLGGLLFVFGTGWLLKQTGVVDMPWSAVTSLVLVALGLALVATARSRARTVPLMLVGVALTAGLAFGSSNIDIQGGVGERNLAPTLLSGSKRYHLGIGDMKIDLRHLELEEGETTVYADVGVGHLSVRVPPEVALRVDVKTNFGNAVVLGEQLNIHGRAHDSRSTKGYAAAARRLRLVLKAGIGQIDVIH